MPEKNAPRPIAEIINEEREMLLSSYCRVYPSARENIHIYADSVVSIINKTIGTNSGKNALPRLDEICKALDDITLGGRPYHEVLPDGVLRFVEMIRRLTKEQILKGKVKLGKVPVKPKKKLESSEEIIILAETKA